MRTLARMSARSFLIAVIAVATCATQAHALSTEGSIGVVSDYRWRGASMSGENPSLQAEATLSADSGFWLWGGANSVGSDYGGTELEIGAGYTHDVAGVEWTLGAERYAYPGEEGIDYIEVDFSGVAKLGALSLSGGVEYTPEQDNYDEDDTYLWTSAEYAFDRVRVHGKIGRDDGVMAPAPHAVDYSVGAAIPLRAVELDFSYVDSEDYDAAWVLGLAYHWSNE